jgi:hypothetical protein
MGPITLEIKTLKDINSELISELESSTGVRNCERVGDHVLRLSFEGTSEEQAEIVSKAYNSGLGLMSVNESGKNLESLYMEMTEGDEIA